MAVTVDQTNVAQAAISGTGTGGASFNTTATVASDAMIVVLAGRFNSGSPAATLTMSGGGLTWAAGHNASSSNIRLYLFYAFAPSGLASGTTLTITNSAGTADVTLVATSYSGVDSAAAPVAFNAAAATAAGWASGTVAAASGNLLVGGAWEDGALLTSTPTGPAVERQDFNSATTTESVTLVDKIGVTGSDSLAGTWSSSVAHIGIGVAFQAATAAAVEPQQWRSPFSPAMRVPGRGPRGLVEARYAPEPAAVGSQDLVGQSDGTSATTGDLIVAVGLAGTSTSTSTSTGALSVARPLAGQTDGTSTTTGAVNVTHPVAGTSAGTSTSSGDVTVAHTLTGTSAGTSTTTGALAVTHPLAGTSSGTSTTTGDLSLAGQQSLAGTSAGTSTTAGALNVAHPLAGTSAGTSTSTGDLRVTHPLAGTSAGISTSSGDLILVKPLAGTSAGTSTTTGAAVITRGLAGSSAGTSSSTGDARVAHTLTGLSSGASTTTGDLRAALVLAAVSAGASTTTGELSVTGLIQAVGRLESDLGSTVTDARSVVTATDSTGTATSTEAAGGVLALTE